MGAFHFHHQDVPNGEMTLIPHVGTQPRNLRQSEAPQTSASSGKLCPSTLGKEYKNRAQ